MLHLWATQEKKRSQTQLNERTKNVEQKHKSNESLHESNVCVSNLFFYSVIQTKNNTITRKKSVAKMDERKMKWKTSKENLSTK